MKLKIHKQRASCPRCGGTLSHVPDYDEITFDEDLAAAWGYQGPVPDWPAWFELEDEPERAVWQWMYVDTVEVCDDLRCPHEVWTEPRRYWNPETRDFDRPRPPTPVEVARAERAAQIAAGQMEIGL